MTEQYSDATSARLLNPVSTSVHIDAPMKEIWLLMVLGLLMSFGSISTDLYLPAMPLMSKELHAYTGGIELTISSFLIGFSLGQLIWGPLGDRYGRKRPIVIGLVVFIVGASGCALSETLYQLIGWRIVQAIGACAGPVLARAMIRDLYTRDKSAQMLSTLVMIMVIAPLIGPLLGGQILTVWTWHAIFWVLVIIGSLTFFALMTIPDTLAINKRTVSPLSTVFHDYFVVLKKPELIGYIASGAFFYFTVFAYVSGSPTAYIKHYHVAPQSFGWLFGLNVIGIMAVNYFNRRLVQRFGIDRLFYIGTWITAITSIIIGIITQYDVGGLIGLVISLFILSAMNGLIIANSTAGALDLVPHKAGIISSLVGAMHYGAGVISAAILGFLSDDTPATMGIIIAIGGVGCLISSKLLRRYKKIKVL